MEADHKPILNIIDYSFTDESGLDIVKLDIENIGYGTARNIRCFCKIYITPLDSEIYHGEYLTVEKYINECPLSYKIDKLFPYPDHISVEDVWFEPGEYPFDATLQHYSTVRNGTSLSGSEFAKVESVALYYLWTKTEGSLSKATFRFRTMIDILQEFDITQVQYALVLRYEDITGTEYDERITEAIVDTGEDISLEEADSVGHHGIGDISIDDDIKWNDPS